MVNDLIVWSLLYALIFAGLWSLGMLGLRRANFNSHGERVREIRGKDELRSKELEYHNLAIYRDFEFFFKATLAMAGGIVFIATQPSVGVLAVSRTLLQLCGWLQVVTGLLFGTFVFFHQKSKIERWDTGYAWWQPWTWQECWMSVSMLTLSFVLAHVVLPELGAQLSADSLRP